MSKPPKSPKPVYKPAPEFAAEPVVYKPAPPSPMMPMGEGKDAYEDWKASYSVWCD